MTKEFKEFIIRGDALDLAAGVAIGSAFTSIVNQVVQGLIIPLIGWLVATVTGTSGLGGALSALSWSPTKDVIFASGNAISAIITSLTIGLVLFLVVKTTNRAKNLRSKEEQVGVEETPTAEDYLSGIRDLLAKQVVGDNTHPIE